MGYITKYTGPQIDAALEKGQNLKVVNNGWIRLESSTASPTNLGNLRNPGNYTTSFWTDGPDLGDSSISPINISIVNFNGILHQFITAGQKVYVRQIESGENSYSAWSTDQSDGAINPSPSAPVYAVDGKTVWLDTSNANEPILKLYINGEWKGIVPEGSMLTDIYDPQGKKTDIFKYIDDTVASISTGTVGSIDSHINDNTIHVTTTEKSNWNNGATQEDIDNAANNLETILEGKVTEEINSQVTKINDLKNAANNLNTTIITHENNSTLHPTLDKQAIWNSKAAGDHTHHLDGRVVVDTSHITGEITSDLLPYDVKERVYVIGSEEELFAITKNPVHNGDTFCIESENGNTWYFVVDDNYLGIEGFDYWKEYQISTTPRNWQSVCYGNGKFVAIAYGSNAFAYSSDGITWTERIVSETSRDWIAVCYGGGKFVAIARDSNIFAYSTDGINWREKSIGHATESWRSVCYGNGIYIIVAYDTNSYLYSYDGENWDSTSFGLSTRNWQDVCYGGGKFVAISYDSNIFAYSIDGITWTEKTVGTLARYWVSICYGGGKFVAITCGETTSLFAYSTDGITWKEVHAFNDYREWYDICYGNGKFVAIDYISNSYITSSDGINWSVDTISNNYREWTCICSGNDLFVAMSASNISAKASLMANAAKAFKKFAVTELTWSNITNTPTTLAGYGITDAVTKEEYSAIEAEVTSISETIPSDIDLSNTAAAHTLYTEAVNNLKELDEVIVAMDSTIAKLEAICQ